LKILYFQKQENPMLSYRHSFHAGNHADVLKHTVQSLIIESMKEKEKPFLYLDTHAGAGRYQLSGEHAERTGEYLEGIARLWQRDDLPAELAPYMSVINYFNRNESLRYYPGSPLIARQLLREDDKLQMTELHLDRLPNPRILSPVGKRPFCYLESWPGADFCAA